MEKVQSVIIDDEPGNIVTLTELLREYCPEIEVCGTAPDPVAGEKLIRQAQPQLVFLDIEMPYGNAFDLLDALSPVNFEVIFITAFDNYAVKAFRYSALDYILKPVNIYDLKSAVQKITAGIMERRVNLRVSNLLSNMKPGTESVKKIALPASDGLYFEDLDNISHFTAEGNYTRVFIRGQKRQLVTKSLKDYEDILPDSLFCRIHHSFIININYVKKYHRGRGGYIEMQDGTTIEVSARKKAAFLERFIG
jgi:two-component system, LytTR family, response regulator